MPDYSVFEYLELVALTLETNASPDIAEQQSRYMKQLFPFFGIKAQHWVPLIKDLYRKNGCFTGDALTDFVQGAFSWDQREMHYCGLQMAEHQLKKQSPEFIKTLEWCIEHKSWWDSVDWIAKLVGLMCRQHPGLIDRIYDPWLESGHLWKQRVIVIHQLTYRQQTDEARLYDAIERVLPSKEFFIQKACGWALRQYSKTAPDSVRHFIDTHTLPPLTVREGKKHL